MQPKMRNIKEAARPIVERCLDLILSKNEDYGSGNLLQTGVRGTAVRLNDKVNRVLTLTGEQREGRNDESVSDTLTDVTNYGLIGRMLQEGLLFEKQKIVYLAGPIDVEHWSDEQREAYQTNHWRHRATNYITSQGHAVFNPHRAFYGADYRVAAAVMKINREAILSCDVMLAWLVDGVTLGTAREIEFANLMGKRVVAVLPDNYAPFDIHDLENVYGGLEEAVKHI